MPCSCGVQQTLEPEAVTTIVRLGQSGWGAKRIARTLGIVRNTVRRYLVAGSPPDRRIASRAAAAREALGPPPLPRNEARRSKPAVAAVCTQDHRRYPQALWTTVARPRCAAKRSASFTSTAAPDRRVRRPRSPEPPRRMPGSLPAPASWLLAIGVRRGRSHSPDRWRAPAPAAARRVRGCRRRATRLPAADIRSYEGRGGSVHRESAARSWGPQRRSQAEGTHSVRATRTIVNRRPPRVHARRQTKCEYA